MASVTASTCYLLRRLAMTRTVALIPNIAGTPRSGMINCRFYSSSTSTTTATVAAAGQTLTKQQPSSSDGESSDVSPGGVFEKIGIVGSGMIAEAILAPMVSSGLQPADKIQIYDVNLSTMQRVQERTGVNIASSLNQVVQDADLVICAVKPQNLTDGFYHELKISKHHENAIFLSVIAGKAMAEFAKGGFTKIVRSMPNTPATIGQGMTVWSCTENINSEERQKIKRVLSSCGKSMYVDDESYIDMATSISGSGPAYIFMLMVRRVRFAIGESFF
jgi:pyrroline-5-carboxylate reductase